MRESVAILVFVLFLPCRPVLPDLPGAGPRLRLADLPSLSVSAQTTFEQAIKDVASPDASARLRAARFLKQAADPEAALPLTALVSDPKDEVQLEAIAAELNIFLADKIVPRKRVGLVVEVRNAVSAEAAFSGGPLALGPLPVPAEVLTALRTAVRDENPRVGIEALYAFGALGVEPGGDARRSVLRTSGPDLAALVGAPDPAMRYAAVRVLGRVFARRPADDRVEETVGDAVIAALNDRDRLVKTAAMTSLGAMRYDRGLQALTDQFRYYGKGEVAAAALDALARIANPASAPVFTAQLASTDAALRGIAIEGLARMGDASKLADIKAAVRSERSDSVLLAAAFATVMLSDAPVDPISEALARPRLRGQARDYVVTIATGHASRFARQLQDPDARVRTEVVDAIGLTDDPSALPVVEPLVTDRDGSVAHAAERAVVRLRKAARSPAP
jgi:HEAT repeat protein